MKTPKLIYYPDTGKVEVLAGDAFDRARTHSIAPKPITQDKDVSATLARWLKEGKSDETMVFTRASLD